MQMYVLVDGLYYCSKSDTNRIMKVQNINSACKFETEEKAKMELKRSSNKLKGFNVLEIECEPEAKKVKTKSIPKIKVSKDTVCKRIQFSSITRKEIYRKSQGNCCLCGKFVDYEEFTIDHIIPLAKGGTNEIDNLQCACKVCNKIKTDVLPDEFTDKITEMIIYSMNQKYNKIIGRKILGMLITSNLHRLVKQK